MTYPRPDFVRPGLTWTPLNGPWSFNFDAPSSSIWPQEGLPNPQTITVPYTFQTPASGINRQEAHEVVWYEREVTDLRTADELSRGNRLLLRFGGVDYECWVWVDGVLVGQHTGGQVGFDLDVSERFTAGLGAAHRVTIRVRDSPTDLGQPRGKQYWGPVPENIFYTPSTGIWGDVWVESVPAVRISETSVLRGDDIVNGLLQARVVVDTVTTIGLEVEVEAKLKGVTISTIRNTLPHDKHFANLVVDMRGDTGLALWTPDSPTLYDIEIRLYRDTNLVDTVHTTTGMRSLDWRAGDSTFRLNGKPLFQALVLDQGYWPETGLTPPSHEALKEDILLSKAMGFNGCRKHQQVEHPVFLYWADRLGYLVWGEIGNAYEFNHEYVERFNSEWTAAVVRDRNHPCIVAWTPVNESWGYTSLKDSVEQRNHIRALYYLTKTLDPSRPVNDNCGWEHVVTDLTTYHDYADSDELARTCSQLEGGILAPKAGRDMFPGPIHAEGILLDAGAQHTPGAPVICTEFGGVNIAPAKDAVAGERDWGYTTAADPDDLLRRLEKLIMAVVKGGHSCGFVYTQLYDIEQEVNGLYAYDRREKVPAERVKVIVDQAQQYYYERVSS